MGGCFVVLVTSGTIGVVLVLSSGQHSPNPALPRQVFAQPSAFSHGQAFDCFSFSFTVDAVLSLFLYVMSLGPVSLDILTVYVV